MQPRLALIVSIALTIVAPLSMPLLPKMLGSDVTLDMYFIAQRLTVIIGTAGAIAAIALRWRKKASWILPTMALPPVWQ
jgi:ACR3 family arsenite transporter